MPIPGGGGFAIDVLTIMRGHRRRGLRLIEAGRRWAVLALFELGDELVGAEGGIGAGGLAEGGGFATSEGGEAFLPVRRGRPVPAGGGARSRCARAEDQR